MRRLNAIISIVLAVPLSSLRGQEPPLPAKTETPAPSPSLDRARPQLNIPVERPKLVPDAPDSTPVSTANVPPKKALPLSELDVACPQSPVGPGRGRAAPSY
jgi:hypothetical protein